MAQTTANFGFNIAEGTDVVNLLTQCYPNFTSLDSILQGIKETGVTTATATKVGTVFQVVRTDSDCNMFRFVATANYASGDTFTVDGVAVTTTAMDGTALPAGAFVINQSVVGILNSGVLTIVGVVGASSVAASDVTYDNTGSGLTATDVQNAIDEVVGDIPTGFAATAITYNNSGSGLVATQVQDAIDELAAGIGGSYVEVTADGTKTNAQLLNALYALINVSKVTPKAVLDYKSGTDDNFADLMYHTSDKSTIILTNSTLDGTNKIFITRYTLNASASKLWYQQTGGAATEVSNNIAAVGTVIRFYY